MNNAKSTIHGGLYDFLSEAKKRTLSTKDSTKDKINNMSTMATSFSPSKTYQNMDPDNSYEPQDATYNNDSYHKIAPIIPKNFSFIIKAATFSAVKENSQNDFSAKMQLFSVSIYIL